MNSESKGLPASWRVVRLGDICKTTSGGTPSRSRKDYYGGDIPWVKSGELCDGIVSEIEENITEKGLKNSSAKVFKKGSLLIALYGATVGKLGILSREAATNQAVCGIFSSEAIETKYLFWYLRSIRSELIDKGQGGAQPNISQGIVKDILIPLAPLKDQQRIVAEIEKQFSRLDEAVALLKRIQANLKRYKAAVLKAAVEGKLTEQWRKDHPDVEPADQLLKRILAERRTKWEAEELAKMKAKGIKPQDDSWKKKYKEPAGPNTSNLPELPEGWVWASLMQVFKTITDGDHQPPPQTQTGIPFLVIGNVRTGVIDFSDTRFVSPEYYEAIGEERTPRKNDILYTLVGSYGIAVLIDDDREFCIQRHIGVLKPGFSTNIRFFRHVLNSNFVFKQATNIATGTAQLTVPLVGLRMVAVHLPPESEQEVILEEIDCRLSVTHKLETTVNIDLKRAERLRQTILQKAFSGGLT